MLNASPELCDATKRGQWQHFLGTVAAGKFRNIETVRYRGILASVLGM